MERNSIIVLIVLAGFACAFAAAFVLVFLRSRKGTEASAIPMRAPTLKSSFDASLSGLKGRVSGDRYQYRVPWVLALGEEGAGKSALLDQLAPDDAGSPEGESGIQWRFLSGGALIEVSGSFLFSRGPSGQSRPWTQFLRLLLRRRAERPIDGIVLFIGAPALLAESSAEISQVQRQTAAAAVRAKLDQLQQMLGVAAPVFAVVTKCDEVRGFRAFCETAGPPFQDDMFGWSNPNTLDSAFQAEWIDAAFDAIQEDLLRHQLRVFGQRLAVRAEDLFVFPLEFARLQMPLQAYLTECFEESSYLDPHFLRGIYFCGDASPLAPVKEAAAATDRDSGTALPAVSPRPLVLLETRAAEALRRRIAFARHLFEFKVFLEAGIVRSLPRVWFPRQRLTLGLQSALALFVIVFGIGTWRGYERLLELRDHKFKGVLDILATQLTNPGGQAYPIATAYDFVDDLGVLDAQGFRSFFLPASLRDPINANISSVISESFSQTVLPSLQSALNARAAAVIGNCGAVPAAAIAMPEEVDALEVRKPQRDVEYIALEKALDDYAKLREAIYAYDNIRSASRGSFADLNKVFIYLTGRSLQEEGRFRQNPYYRRALEQASYGPVPAFASGRLDDCARAAAASRIHNFFESWFDKNNPLINVTDGVASQIDDLQTAREASRDTIERLVNDIRGLDNMLSGGSYAWLNQTDYSRANFPILSSRLPSMPFAGKAFLDTADADGSEHFTQTKRALLSAATVTAGQVLASTTSQIRVSAQVMALQNALSALLGQDFMSGQQLQDALPSRSQSFLWNKAALAHATQMEESRDKYLREWLPLLPSGLRDAVRSLADHGLQSSVLNAVVRGQEPLDTGSAPDLAALALEIASFQSAAPLVLQLQNVLPPDAKNSQGGLSMLLARQCLYLADRVGTAFPANSLYEPAQANLKKWDGTQLLTEAGYGIKSGDELETYFARQREQTKKVALEYAQPLAQYIAAHALASPKSFTPWPGILRDVEEYDAKKPGNAIAALETFIRVDLNKIDPKSGCAGEAAGQTGSDYFLTRRVELQSAIVARCGEIIEENYTRRIAGFFNQRLAGSFPFGPWAAGPDASAASLSDTVEFFGRLAAYGPGIEAWLRDQHGVAAAWQFLQQAEAARQMFAASGKDGALSSDFQLAFRVNRAAEVLGDRIIDWEFRSGDQVSRSSAPTALRWAYGDQVQLTLRFAKDSPEIPIAGGGAVDARVEGRTIAYSYTDPWALFSLLRRHEAAGSGAKQRAPGLMRFIIPVCLDTTRPSVAAAPSASPPAARFFIRAEMRAASAKEPVAAPVAAFPEAAPLWPGATEMAAKP